MSDIQCPLKFKPEYNITDACSGNLCAWWIWTDKAKGMGCCAIAILASQLSSMASGISREFVKGIINPKGVVKARK